MASSTTSPEKAETDRAANKAVNSADRRAAQLAREIDGHRRRGYTEQALVARQEMVQLIEESYGKDSWQTCSARLALWREQSITAFTPEKRQANETAEARTRSANESWQNGNADEALASIVSARSLATQVWGADTYGVANLLDQEAHWRQAKGDAPTAETLFRQALKIREQVFTRLHPETISTASSLGRLLLATQHRDEAGTLLKQCVDDAAKVWGEEHPDYGGHLNNLALLYLDSGDHKQAATLFARTAEIWLATLGDKSPRVGEAQLNLGRTWYAAGDYAQAVTALNDSLTSLEASLGKENAITRKARSTLGLAQIAVRNYPEAESLLQTDVELTRRQFGEDHPETAEGLLRLAILYGNQGRYPEAMPLVERAAAIHHAKLGPDSALSKNANSIAAMVRSRLARDARTRPAGVPASSAAESGGTVRTSFEQPVKR
ncbi:MAG TPA: tetratricopeptide repeat protein [Pirellulales bacterium]